LTAHFSERELSIPADLSRLRQVRDWAERAALDYGFESVVSYQIKMATSEAVANAVEHGSRSSSDEVRVRARDEGGALALYVTDNGNFVSRMAAPGSLSERGRGLAFMGQLMDEVDLRRGPEGTVIRFSKRLGAL
jgi:anti-sigma regulatory factor (Ser/Thr protein kinase)